MTVNINSSLYEKIFNVQGVQNARTHYTLVYKDGESQM